MTRGKATKASGRVQKRGGRALRVHSSTRAGAHMWRLLSLAFVTLVALGFAEGIVWLGALSRELGVLVATLATLTALAAVLTRTWLHAALLACAALALWWPSWPLLRAVRLTPEHGPLLRVAEATLAGSELGQARLRELMRDARPDVLAVVGASQRAVHALDLALPELPHRAHKLGRDGQQALWSRLPLRGSSRDGLARVRVGKCDVQLALVALPSMFRLSHRPERARELRALHGVADSARAIWLGALGARPQAADLAPLLTKQRLRDTRLGHGLLASTPTWLGPLGVASDHILVRGWIAVRKRSVHAPLGDAAHRTQSATLELTEPRCR